MVIGGLVTAMNNNITLSIKAKCFDCNLPNLDMTIKAYQQEIIDRPFETDQLTAEMIQVCSRYQERDLSCIPPHLPRMIDETPEQHLTRLYNAHIPIPKGDE